MTALVVLPAELTGHVSLALELYARRLRGQSIPVPPDLVELQKWCSMVHRGPELAPVPEDVGLAPLLLSLPEVAALLGCGLSKVKRMVGSGALRVVLAGKVRRVRRADLEQYVDALALAGGSGPTGI